MFFENQIEEMVFALTESQHEFDKAWKECLHNNAPTPDRENVFYAKYLIENKGYRNASEVAREIFYDIEYVLINVGYFDTIDFHRLQRKYLGGKYNDNKKTH